MQRHLLQSSTGRQWQEWVQNTSVKIMDIFSKQRVVVEVLFPVTSAK